jgi:hypothetical protein
MDNTPRSAKEVLQTLTGGFVAFSPQLQRAARFIIDHPREIGVQSMRALAVKAEVHPNTLVRLAQQIGFDGYDALRERFRDFVVAEGLGSFRDRAEWLQEMAAHGGSAEVVAGMATATAQNVEAMWQRQDAAVLDAKRYWQHHGPMCWAWARPTAWRTSSGMWRAWPSATSSRSRAMAASRSTIWPGPGPGMCWWR